MRASGWIENDRESYKAVVRMPDGTRRSKRFSFKKYGQRDAKRRATEWKHELCLAVERGTATDPRNERVMFSVWAKDFLASEALTLRANTIAQHEDIFKNRISPAFDALTLGAITPAYVQQFIDDLSARYASASVRKTHQVLYKCLEAAVDAQMLNRNPCRLIRLPQPTRTEMRFLTPAEVAKLAGKIDAQYRALVMLGAYGGLRIGELAGLRPDCIDFKSSSVQVRQTAIEVKGHTSFGFPKTNRGIRRVPLPEAVTELLRAHLDAYGTDNDLVFHAPQGGVIRPNLWRRRFWAPAVTAAKLTPLTPHALRHTAVSIWIAANVSPAEIALRAGHASTAFVLDNYGHLFPQGDAIFRDSVSRLYVKPK